MKYTAPALANERYGVKFFVPHDPRYYHARHRRENVDCMWIEVKRLGHVFCYPYLINDRGRVYEFGNSQNPANIERNEALIKRWNEIISPESLDVDWTWRRMEEDDFRALRDRLSGDDDEGELLDTEGEPPALEEGEKDDVEKEKD